MAASAAVLGASSISHAHAQGMLTFSGGGGAPLTLTLNAPVTYTITTASGSGLEFDFQGAGNPESGEDSLTGTSTFSINGGAAQTINAIRSGLAFADVGASDILIFGALPTVSIGDIVVLSAGTVTTGSAVMSAPPASGSYPTFIVDARGNKLDAANGVAGPVPEPSTWALLGLGMAGLGLALRQRRLHTTCATVVAAEPFTPVLRLGASAAATIRRLRGHA